MSPEAHILEAKYKYGVDMNEMQKKAEQKRIKILIDKKRREIASLQVRLANLKEFKCRK